MIKAHIPDAAILGASALEERLLLASLQVFDAYIQLAASGKMPRGAQRSADRKLPHFEARVERYQHLLARDQAPDPDA